MQPVAQKNGEAIDLLRRDDGLGRRHALVQVGNVSGELVTAKPQGDQPFAQTVVLGIHEPLLHQLKQAGYPGLGLAMGLAKIAHEVAIAILPLQRGANIGFKHALKTLGLEHPLRHLVEHDAVETVHADAHAAASDGSLLEAT